MDRTTELLVALHQGLRRLGPGSAACTLKALALCADLPPAPGILDVGCGTGAQSLVLASATGGCIVATDLIGAFLGQLPERAAAMGLEGRIQTVAADMHCLPFRDGSFDLIWSEGAAYIMGFDKALTTWRALARPGGYLVVSELSWFRPDPPAEISDFWERHYPSIRGVDENLAAAQNAGWTGVGNFPLPAEAWDRYHAPLKHRLAAFRRSYVHDPAAQAVADMTEREISLMARYADFCGYELFVLRRGAQNPREGSATC
ncbi:MAG: class I SAM-dependent methyltransferase [Pseudomonadota bacterium]|nr:class I SAM-dependent methyltransferase [Pseudomonadota bacterium]